MGLATTIAAKEKLDHPLAVRSRNENGFYWEYDKHDRVVFYEDCHGYWTFCFYSDVPHDVTPYFVLHKYFRLYNPNLKMP